MSDGKTERAESALLDVIERISGFKSISTDEMVGLAALATAFAELRKL